MGRVRTTSSFGPGLFGGRTRVTAMSEGGSLFGIFSTKYQKSLNATLNWLGEEGKGGGEGGEGEGRGVEGRERGSPVDS